MNKVFFGDCRDTMRDLIAQGVKAQMCVTSPPYYWQRDYGHAGQLGLEATPAEYVEAMVKVFALVRELLADDGVLWLNIGDTYNNRTRVRRTSHQPSMNGFSEESWAEATKRGVTRLSVTCDNLKEKDLFGIPWAVATALRADGWFLRQEVIWRKTFGKPEPTKDRMPCRHEHIFLLSKTSTYFFDRAALPEWANDTVWQVPPTGSREHGAAFPSALVEPCIKAGSRPGDTVLDCFFGSGTTGEVAGNLGRNWIGCEINDQYAPLQQARTAQRGLAL